MGHTNPVELVTQFGRENYERDVQIMPSVPRPSYPKLVDSQWGQSLLVFWRSGYVYVPRDLNHPDWPGEVRRLEVVEPTKVEGSK